MVWDSISQHEAGQGSYYDLTHDAGVTALPVRTARDRHGQLEQQEPSDGKMRLNSYQWQNNSNTECHKQHN